MRDPSSIRADQTASLMNVQEALDQLEEAVLSSPRLLGWRTLISEEAFLEQLDEIRLNLPSALAEAEELLLQREAILQEAQRYAQEIVAAAERRADQLLNESRILRQAQIQADQLLRQTHQEQDEIRQRARQESEQMREEANRYVDQVLHDLEMRLVQSLQVIRNGRQQLHS